MASHAHAFGHVRSNVLVLVHSIGTTKEILRPVAAPSDDTEPVLLTEVAGRVGTITLNRPARRNALNAELIGALDVAVRQMADDPEVKVVVLTGAAPEGGHGGFCSGGDVKDGASGPGGEKGVPVDALSGDLSRHDQHAAMLLHLMPKPTIAMVGGPAVGAGCSLAAACDLRFASEDAVFSVSFTPNGLSGDYGGSVFWTRIGGTGLARRLYLLNEKITASRALGIGHGARGAPTDRSSAPTPTRSPDRWCRPRPRCWRWSRTT